MWYQTRDPLTGLHIEVFVNILSHFSISDFLELSHVHPIIQDAFKANAAQICNLAIENDPELLDRAYSVGVNANKINKWLVPKYFLIVVGFTLAQRIISKPVFTRLGTPGSDHKYTGYFLTDADLKDNVNALGRVDPTWNTAGLKIKLNEPGPQFLSFLEWQRNEKEMPNVKIEDWGQSDISPALRTVDIAILDVARGKGFSYTRLRKHVSQKVVLEGITLVLWNPGTREGHEVFLSSVACGDILIDFLTA